MVLAQCEAKNDSFPWDMNRTVGYFLTINEPKPLTTVLICRTRNPPC